MSTRMPWYDLTANPKVVHGYYSGAPPLDHMELHGVRLHRDGPVLHLSADLTPFPDMPSKRWPAGANTAQIDLALWGVRLLTIEGWTTDMVGVFTLEHVAEHRLRFSFLSDTATIRGECIAARIDGITGYVTTAELDGPANRSQPIEQEPKRTPPAAGSGG
jgi:hypothetical protein